MDRGRALGFLQSGWSARRVAEHFGVHRVTISRLNSRFRDTGHVQDRSRSGRPRITTVRQDRYIETTAVRRRFVTARSIQLDLQRAAGPGAQRISDQTVRNRLHAATLRARRPAKCPALTDAHRAARLQWARQHRRWTRQDWGRVLFSDESRFCLRSIDGRLRVWRRRGERYTDVCVQPAVAFGGGSVMIWGGISDRTKTNTVHIQGNLNSPRYIAEVLQPHVVPHANQIGNGFIFQDDNARPHRARIVDQFLQAHGIQRMVWPACSPDLEALWDQLGRAATARMQANTTLDQLRNILTEEWNAIDQARITRLINSMRRRCVACIDARGGYTRY